MNNKKFHSFLHKQILVLVGLSLFPGLGYILLGWLNNVALPAVLWYGLVMVTSLWGYRLYKAYLPEQMSRDDLEKWYHQLSMFFYTFFFLWTLIFILYCTETTGNLHYIAIFTQLGASVVASTLLVPDKKLYTPSIIILMLPLIIYFFSIQEAYGYILSVFSCIFMGVLIYAANINNTVLMKTYYQAFHDHLTGLYNRNHFIGSLQQTINLLKAKQHYSYLLLIDLDYFKTINDSLGHDVGDLLLIEVSQRMQQHISKQHTLARLGGDEFIIIGPEFDNKEASQQAALTFSEQLLESIKATYFIYSHQLYISASIGVNLLSPNPDKDHIKAGNFIKEADIAMYEVKASGRDGVILFDKEFSNKIEKNLEIERLLHFALARNEIELKFQAQLDRSQSIIGCEVLVRWNNKELGLISPADFIPIAEQTGMIIDLGRYIMEKSFQVLYEWENKGIKLKQFSINISMRQIFHHKFIDEVKQLCHQYQQQSPSFQIGSKVIFELTETIAAEDINKLITIMNQLKQLGIKFSMDDFGTGYSSLSYITQLPLDELKIDRSFVSHLDENEQNKAIISAILNLAKTFKLNIVAEGVEALYQVEFLTQNECDILQGFYFSKAINKADFEDFYLKNKKLNYIN